MDDLADGDQRRIGKPGVIEQHFEGAAIADMGELGVEHVEPQVAVAGRVSLSGDELELGVRVDETDWTQVTRARVTQARVAQALGKSGSA